MESSLLLDRNYLAVSIVGWKKALKLLIREKVEPVGNHTIKKVVACSKDYEVPSILKLKHPISYNCFSNRVKFSRSNVILRDKHHCQYCNKALPKNSSTIDHVFPKSRGGKTNYLNCVACCKDCNGRKGDHIPEEVGMKLLRAPKRPNFLILCCLLDKIPKEWNDFILGV